MSRAPTAIHVHEDDWGMRSLHALAVYRQVAANLDESIAAEERNRAPSGFGWTDIHVIEDPSSSYVEADLRLSDAAAAVGPIMPRVRHFHATSFGGFGDYDRYGSYENDAWAFGLGAHCYLKLDDEGAHVKRIWFDLSSPDPHDIAALRQAMLAIDRLVPSFIADYFMKAVVILADSEALDRYLETRRTDIEEFERWRSGQRED